MVDAHDETFDHLGVMQIKAPRADAVDDIVAYARQNPRRSKSFRWVNLLLQLRAWIYVPQMRYVIMASIVGGFMLMGAISDPPAPSQPANYNQHVMQYVEREYAANVALSGVIFPEENWADDFWSP